MIKIKRSIIQLKDLKHLENSRIRSREDVADLMADIEQRGLMQPIGVRIEDNAIIYGNRRVKAYENLGYTEIEADFFEGVTDDDLLIMNLAENIKRAKIGSIEIGRVCKLLQKRGMSNLEISEKLKISYDRVRACVAAFEVVIGTPFENLIIYGSRGDRKGIPESLIWTIQNTVSKSRRLTREDWNLILNEIEAGKFISANAGQLRKIILANPEISMKDALNMLGKGKISYVVLSFDVKKLNEILQKEKCDNEKELVRIILRKYDKDLLY